MLAIRASYFSTSAAIDPNSGLPPRLKKPKEDWFAPDKPANANPGDDWLIEIYDGRFVGCIYPEETEPMVYGDLRSSSQFVAWFHHHAPIGHASGMMSAKWQHPWRLADRLDPRFLNYQFEDQRGMMIRFASRRKPPFAAPLLRQRSMPAWRSGRPCADISASSRQFRIPPSENPHDNPRQRPRDARSQTWQTRRRRPAKSTTPNANKPDEEYRVGPGRPPKEFQFKPGQSGNPKGAKRKHPIVPDLKATLERALNGTVTLSRVKRSESKQG